MRSLPTLHLLVSALAFSVCGMASAQLKIGDQWRLRSPSPTPVNLSTVVITPTAAVAAGNGTTVLRSLTAAQGATWTASRVNALSSVATSSYIAYAGTRLLMASGTSFYQSLNDGVTWQPVATDLPPFQTVLGLSGAEGEFMALLRTSASSYASVLATSTDGASWSVVGQVDAGPDVQADAIRVTRNPAGRYVVIGTNRYSATGEFYGAIWSTTDGSSWDTEELPVIYGSASDVIWTGSRFVVVGAGAVQSTDGITWTAISSLTGAVSIAKGGSTLLAARNQAVLTSTDDGLTWTETAEPPDPFSPVDIVHNGTVWIGVGFDGLIHTSTNGVNWIRRAPVGNLVSFHGIAHNGLSGSSSRYIAIGSDTRAWRSTDGTSWTQITLLTFPGAQGVIWDGTQFVVVSDFFSSMSPDGISWSSVGMFGDNSQDSDIMTRLRFADGKYVAIGYDYVTNKPEIYSGTAPDAFVRRTVPAGSGNLMQITRAGSLWIVVGDGGTILTSPDGNVWTKRAVDDNTFLFSTVASTGSLHIAASDSLWGYYTSTDGIKWTYRDRGFGRFPSLGAADGRIIGFGSDETQALTTTDGINWSPVELPMAGPFNDVVFSGSELMAVGRNRAFISSDLVPEVSFGLASQSLFESSATASVLVKLSSPAPSAVSLPISVLGNSTAVQGTDYSTVPTTVDFAAGQELAFLEVPLLNDAALDGNKTLSLGVGTVAGVRSGPVPTTAVTLVDDDSPPTLSFTVAKRTVAEHGGTVVVQAELSWPAPAAVSATITRSGDATEGTDYTAPASLSFTTGERTKTFSISIVTDNIFEMDELVTFTLDSVTGATVSSNHSSFKVTILDDDAESLGRRWTLRQPTPTADGMFNLGVLGSTLIAAGNGGTIVTSSDAGVSWTRRESGLTPDLTITDVLVSGGRAYALADGGHVASSDDGILWVDRIVPGATSSHFFGGGATNGTRMVLAGDFFDETILDYAPHIYTSTDGVSWTREVLPFNRGSLYDVAWNGSLFVAVGNRPSSSGDFATYILTSPDGRAWTSRSSAITGASLYSVVAAGTSFVALDHTRNCYTSPDGLTWTKRAAGTLGEMVNGVSNGSKFVGVGRAITSSTDLATFTQTASPDAAWLDDIVFTGGQFVAVGGISNIYTSPDGVSWTKRSGGFHNYADFTAVTWAGSQFVGVGGTFYGSVPTLIATSPDGIAWSTVPNKLNKELTGVASSGKTLVAVGKNGTIATSATSSTWALKKSGTTLDLHSVIWVRNQFVAVGGHATGEDGSAGPGGAIVLTSPDGNTWTRRIVPTNRPLLSVCHTGEIFVAVGRSTGDGPQPGPAAVVTSPDGIRWTARDSAAPTDFTSVAGDAFTLVATGADYRLYSSSDDGVSWTQIAGTPAPRYPGDSLFTIMRTPSGFLAAGDFGQTLFGNGATWAGSVSESFGAIRALATNSKVIVAAGTRSCIQTSGILESLNTPSVSFLGGFYTQPEDAGSMPVIVRLSSPPTTPVTVTIGTDPANSTVTLTGPEADVIVPSTPLVFAPGETEKIFAVGYKADKRLEGNETLRLTIATITGGANSPSSATVDITLLEDDVLPTAAIFQPSQLQQLGASFSMIVNVLSPTPYTIQWNKDGKPLPASVVGSKSDTLFIAALTLKDGGSYTVSVTNATTTVTTAPVRIGVYEHPQFPSYYTGSGSFTATQKASSNCVLHWFKDGNEITTSLPTGVTMPANRTSLTVKNLSANSGTYTCNVELPGVTMAPYTEGSRFLIYSGIAPPVLAPMTTLPPATVGQFYFANIGVSSGSVDKWLATGLPKGLYMQLSTIYGFPEAPVSKPKAVTINGSNGVGKSTIKPTIIVNPIPSGIPGTHVALLPRQPGVRNLGGLLTMTVTANGYFTATFQMEGQKGSIVGRVASTPGQLEWAARDVTGFATPSVIIGGKKVTVVCNFNSTGTPSGTGSIQIDSDVSIGASFGSQQALSGTSLTGFPGRYHYALRLKNGADVGNLSLPQGHGFGTATVSATGNVVYTGKMADGTAFSASSPLLVGNISPLFTGLYADKGSLMALPAFTLAGAGNVDSTVLDTASGTWSKLPNSSPASARTYPAGWAPTDLKLEGSRYLPPTAPTAVFGLSFTPGAYNGTANIDLSSFPDEPQYSIMEIGIPHKGAISAPFPDPVTLRLSVVSITGLFTGTSDFTSAMPNFVLIPRSKTKLEAQVVRIIGAPVPEQAYGFLSLPALPDYRISPAPAANTTPIYSIPVTIAPQDQ